MAIGSPPTLPNAAILTSMMPAQLIASTAITATGTHMQPARGHSLRRLRNLCQLRVLLGDQARVGFDGNFVDQVRNFDIIIIAILELALAG